MSDLADLFEPPPVQWALRGDPRLWERMRGEFRGEPLPISEDDLRGAIGAAFLKYAGESIDSPQRSIRVLSLAGGHGMSDGQVVPEFWRDTAIPLLVSRWAGSHRT